MFILAFLWAIFSGAAISVGVEPQETWKKVFKVGNGIDWLRRVLLFGGAISGLLTIFLSFYYFVFHNGLIVLGAFVAAFVVGRLFLEIMRRHNPYGETKLPPKALSVDGPPITEEEAQNLPDIGDVEEIEANEFAMTTAQNKEVRVPDGIIASTERAAEMPAADQGASNVVPLSTTSSVGLHPPAPPEQTIKEPQVGLNEPRGNEYNELFSRINSGK